MIDSKDFLDRVLQEKVGLFTGVPCSLLKPFINHVIANDNLTYISATSEGEAIGIATGSYLAGRIAVVMLQNSGLGNIVNPITSLTNIYKIPCLLIISHRGEPGSKDAVQHEIMGRITEKLLDTLGIYHQVFPAKDAEIEQKVSNAFKHIRDTLLPSALVLKKGMVKAFNPEFTSVEIGGTEGQVLDNRENKTIKVTGKQVVIEVANNLEEGELLISTTGKISRELFDFVDRPNNFYMQGSMGCAVSIGLGIALSQNRKKVVVLDGDGAVLMKMGTLATVGHYQPKHFVHIVFDNESYGTTGGQPAVSSTVSFSKIAIFSGYRRAVTVYSLDSFNQYLNSFLNEEGPSMLHIKIKKGVVDKNLGRPTLSPEEIKDRFMECVSEQPI